MLFGHDVPMWRHNMRDNNDGHHHLCLWNFERATRKARNRILTQYIGALQRPLPLRTMWPRKWPCVSVRIYLDFLFQKKCISSRNVWISSWNFFALERPPVLCGLGNKPASVSGLGRGNSVRLTQLLPPQMIRQYRNIWKETTKQFSGDFLSKLNEIATSLNFCNVCSFLWRRSL